MTIQQEIQKLDTDPYVELYELDLSKYGEGIFRWSPNVLPNGNNIVFGGNTYLPMDLKAEGFEWNGRGKPPTPTLSLPGTLLSFIGLMNDYNDLRGCPLTRIRTFLRFLDGQTSPNSAQIFAKDVYKIDRVTSKNKYIITFELTSIIDQQGTSLPTRTVAADYCPWIYRKHSSGSFTYHPTDRACPYQGSSYFRADNTVTTNPAEDSCAKTVSACKLRFGQNSVLPFGGFPGTSKPNV